MGSFEKYKQCVHSWDLPEEPKENYCVLCGVPFWAHEHIQQTEGLIESVIEELKEILSFEG